MIGRGPRLDPEGCDCCGKNLLPVFGTFNRVECEYGWASLPYVLCGDCALRHRGNPGEARVRQWVLVRAARAGTAWRAAVAQLMEGTR